MIQSTRFTLNKADLKSQVRSAFIFLAPSLLSFLVTLTPAVNSIVPDSTGKLIFLIILKWALDQVTGLIRRYVDGPKAK